MSEEILEYSKDIKVGDISITLCNELIQKSNEKIMVSFTSSNTLDEVLDNFQKCESFTYGDTDYKGYSVVLSLEYKKNEEFGYTYKVTLKQDEEELELTQDQKTAIEYAVENMSDSKLLECQTICPEWESFIGGSMDEGQRFTYKGELWKAIQAVSTVLAHQYPSIDTASLYNRIDESHEGTMEDPIPYANTMTVHNGKYYIENGIVYKCIRDSGQPLYATCESLVGNYFEKAEG